MSAGKLVVKQALGLSGNVKNCLTFVEEHHLAYVCGHQIVVINTETKEQNFIPGTASYQHQSLGFTAIACCPSKKVIAIAEKVEPTAIVTFYDSHTLRKKRLLTSPEIGSNEIRSLAFSEDGKYLVTQGAGPEWNLALWLVDKAAKVLCTTKISLSDDNPVHKVSFCPWDNNVILVIGKAILRFFRFVEGQLRPIPLTVRRDNANFISYCWVNEEHLIVGTESGELFLIENFEIRGYINPNKNDSDELYPILCLQTTSRGFIMGTYHGEIKLFERHDDVKEKYLLEDSYIIPGDHGHVLEFALGVDELLICALSRHQLLSSSMSSLYNLNKEAHHTVTIFDHVFAYFHSPNHKGDCEITGIDIALWKQIVVTVSKDNTVRIWNPIDKKIELMKEFDEEPLGVSVHPSGIYIAIMFSDKIKILSILLEEIHLCREIYARQISYIKFSRGGQYLAAGIGTNLQIYQTYTGQQVATLRGHNNRIKSVVWMNYDSQIVTFGVEGVVHSWDLFPINKRPEHFVGTVPILSGTCPLDGSNVYIATNDLTVKEITFAKETNANVNANNNNNSNTIASANGNNGNNGNNNGNSGNTTANNNNNMSSTTNGNNNGNNAISSERAGTTTNNNNNNNSNDLNTTLTTGNNNNGNGTIVRINKTLELPTAISMMVFEENRRLLIMGTNHETMPCSIVVALTSPCIGGSVNPNTPPILDYNILHAASVTALCVSPDGSTVYSGDAAGVICISEFETLSNTLATPTTTTNNNNNNSHGLLKTPIKSQREGFVSFEFVDEVIIHKSDLESRKSQILLLTNTVEELNKNNEHQLRLKDFEFKDKLTDITSKYSIQLSQERMKYEELENEKLNLEKEFQKKVYILEGKHQEELVNMDKKYKLKYNTEENRHKLLQEETRDATKRWNEENEILITSHQKFLEEMTNDYESKLLYEQRIQQEICIAKEHMSVIYDTMQQETEQDGDREIVEMKIRYDSKLKQEEETAQQLISQHASMSKQYESLVKESSQQKIDIKRLKDKESRLYETIHTLEKDIQSHKKEIREREETITDKEKRIFDLKKKNQELEKFRFVLDYKIKELKLQIAPRENEINTMRKQIEEMNLELEQYQKSNLSLNLMIDELKLKMDGIKNELSLQDERVNVNERFLEKFRGDLQELWLYKHDINNFKNKLIRMYRVYVQEELNASTLSSSSSKKSSSKGGKKDSNRKDLDDPQQVYNRDREQLERSLDSLRRAMKTETMAHKRDLGKMMRESVMLTKELNTLRKNARSFEMQKKAIDQAGDLSNPTVLQELMELLGMSMPGKQQNSNEKTGPNAATGEDLLLPQPPLLNKKRLHQVPQRSAALRTTSADGVVNRTTLQGSPDGKDAAALRAISGGGRGNSTTRQDQWEAWREIQIQYDQMKVMEDQITYLCQDIGLDPIPVIVSIDTQLDY